MEVNPFFNWMGGKRRLLKQYLPLFPNQLYTGNIDTYIEPFVGAGTMFFYIAQKFDVKNVVLLDINWHLIDSYITVKNNINVLISELTELQNEYNSINMENKKALYYQLRKLYNEDKDVGIDKGSLFIFLNKTAFNGVYRVNSIGYFNVPFNNHIKLLWINKENFIQVHKMLQNVNILCLDYKECLQFVTANTRIYFDPPYQTVNKLWHIKYTASPFTEIDQIQLSAIFNMATDMGKYCMLRNSYDESGFFERNYYRHKIHSCIARKKENRKAIKEILITNY